MRAFIILLILTTSRGKASDSPEALLKKGSLKEAAFILKRKIKTQFNFKELLLLGKILEKEENYKEAARVYLYGIKKTHGKSWSDIKNHRDLKEGLSDLKKPKKEALLLAFKVAEVYYEIFLTSTSSDSFNRRILDTSLKYFMICDHFSFNKAKSNYFIGIIFKEYEKYRHSALSFLEAWKLFDKKGKNKDRDGKIRLLLGESLIHYGHLEAGTSYLRSVYYEKGRSRYLQNYAAEYLNEFVGSNVGGSFGFIGGTDSNVLLGNSSGEESTSSAYTSKSINLYLSHITSYSSKYNFSLGGAEDKYLEDSLSDNDSRTLSFSSSWEYRKFDYTLIGLSYFLSKSYSRPGSGRKFEFESNTHQFGLSYQRILRRGKLSFSFPYTKTSYEGGSSSSSFGTDLGYTPLSFSPLWTPEFSVSFSLQEEDEGFEKSKNFNIGFANTMDFTDIFSIGLSGNYEINKNQEANLGYGQISLELNAYWLIERFDGLSFELSLLNEAYSPEEGESESRLKMGAGINYVL